MVWDGATDPLLTEIEAAKELRVSRRTVERERKDGRIKFVPIRGRIFYRLSAIEAYKAALECTASPSDPDRTAGTSSGPKADVATAVRRARRIATRLSLS